MRFGVAVTALVATALKPDVKSPLRLVHTILEAYAKRSGLVS